MFCPTYDVKRRYYEIVCRCCRICEYEELAHNIGILFSERFSRMIGEARYYAPLDTIPARGLIRLSTKLFKIVPEEIRRHVVIHESCHIVANHDGFLRGIKIRSHGKEWQSRMRQCGLKPERLIAVNQKYIQLNCCCLDGCAITLSQLQDMIEYGHPYNCNICGVKLIP
jgi:predicted SprT family Zn-dependent metalloprotease